jgi:succinoglycan biosynthesis transport protein ExoP
MPEQLEEQELGQPDFERYVDVVRRRHMYFLVPVFLGWLLVWGSSWVLPPSYKSSTQILVEQPTMPENYVARNVNENLQDRMQSITQQILSRTRLLIIINKLGLYAHSESLKTDDDKVDKMRRDIGPVELVRDARNNEITAFRVSFSARNPVLAQKVTSELTQLFINENNRVQQEQSQGTTNFIEQQLEDARAALAVQEAKVKQFEAAHEGALPSQQASNLQILAGLQGQLQNQQDALNTAKQQRVYFQSLIEQYKNRYASGRSVDGTPTEVTSLDQELTRLRGELTDLSSRYTDSYPDVLKVKAQIAKTEKQRDDLLAAPRTSSKTGNETESTPLLQLQSQLQANQLEIASRERGIAEVEARINEYQGRLNSEPATEQQLDEVSRGYEQSKANYNDLLKKKDQSVMATSMEALQQGERFTILDSPSLPVKPDFPNRMKFCGMGIMAGLGLGCVIVFLIEFLDDRMHGEKELKALLPVKVMAEIPEIEKPGEQERQKRRIVMGWATATVIAVVIVAGSAVSFLRG